MTALETATWRALGTGVRVVVSEGSLGAARTAVEDVLERVDATYSRFRPDSEISAVNARAGEWVAISSLLADAIARGLRAARLTNGAVDPTVGRAMRAIGYDADFGRISEFDHPIAVRLEPIPGWRSVSLSAARREVCIRTGVELDLGSTGKGLAADLAAAAAHDAIGGDPAGGVLVSLGGDVAVRGEPPAGGWRIRIAEDSEAPADGPSEVVAIGGGALATSSTTVRHWRRGGQRFHHLIDPGTGGPVVSPWRTASVVAATCVDANTAATGAIVKGWAAVPWLETTGLAARLVASDGEVVRIGGWPPER